MKVGNDMKPVLKRIKKKEKQQARARAQAKQPIIQPISTPQENAFCETLTFTCPLTGIGVKPQNINFKEVTK